MQPIASKSLTFKCGKTIKNRFALAPLTNTQSNENGTLSKEELHWLAKRGEGQFGMIMTCAVHVQENGKGFPRQLGIFDDKHIEGHQRLTAKLHSYGSIVIVQLHHAGMRSPKELIGEQPICPSKNKKTGARAMSFEEIVQVKDAFISAAIRAKKAGYDGVEIHGAHGYLLAQFLSKDINFRTDKYGGNLENRFRLINEIINGIRIKCGNDFVLGLRLSPERFGMDLKEVKKLCEFLVAGNQLDFIDLSLWDCFKMPEEKEHQNKSLLKHFTDLDFKTTKLTIAGKINSAKEITKLLKAGIDFISVGRSGILHHDFPMKVIENPNFETIATPVSKEYLLSEGLSLNFITYMQRWEGFVE